MVRSTMICFWAVFLVSLGCSLLFHLATSPCKILFILDSGHYLFTAGGIIEAFRHSGHLAEALLAPSLSASIMLDGPVLPSLAAAVLSIFGGLTIILRGPFRDGADGQKRFIANSILAIAIVHALLYLPFEAITRYGFCGVPALFLLAAYGLGQLTGVRRLALLSIVVPAVVMMHSGLVEHFDNPLNLADLSLSTTTLRLIVIGFVVAFMLRWAKSGSIGRIRQIIAVASLLVLLVLPTACLSLHRAEYQGIEISLDANQELERFFELPANADLIGRSNFLLIDYARCRDLRFAVNGVQCGGR